MTTLSVDLYEKFKVEHGFSLRDLEHICWLLFESNRRLYQALAAEKKAGREASDELSGEIAWVRQELEEGTEELKLIVIDLREAIR
jgi:hypothetical protein